MAEIFPDEGLDLILGIVPLGGSNLANTYMGLFTSATASTTPLSTAVLSTYTGVTELTIGSNGYSRQTHAAGSWGAAGAGGGGRQVSGAQQTFTCSTSAWAAVNGFFMANVATHSGDKAIWYSNFTDVTAVTLQVNDTLKITPSWTYLG